MLFEEGDRAGEVGSDLPLSRLGEAMDGAEMVDVVRGVDRTAEAVPCAVVEKIVGGGPGLRVRVRVGESGGCSEGDDAVERRRSGLTVPVAVGVMGSRARFEDGGEEG